MGDITANFSLHEMTESATADRLGIDNSVVAKHMPAVCYTLDQAQRIRDVLRRAVAITSGYRSPTLLEALIEAAEANPLLPMPSKNSDHLRGEAIDVSCAGLPASALMLVVWALHHAGVIQLDKAIVYDKDPTMLHLSFCEHRARGKFMRSPKSGGYVVWSPYV